MTDQRDHTRVPPSSPGPGPLPPPPSGDVTAPLDPPDRSLPAPGDEHTDGSPSLAPPPIRPAVTPLLRVSPDLPAPRGPTRTTPGDGLGDPVAPPAPQSTDAPPTGSLPAGFGRLPAPAVPDEPAPFPTESPVLAAPSVAPLPPTLPPPDGAATVVEPVEFVPPSAPIVPDEPDRPVPTIPPSIAVAATATSPAEPESRSSSAAVPTVTPAIDPIISPTVTPTVSPAGDGAATDASTERSTFEPPTLEPMRLPALAFVGGRILLVAGAVLVALAARRLADRDVTTDEFRAVSAAAGVFAAAGLAGQACWAATLADNARRLRVRSVGPRSQVVAWTLVGVWVALAVVLLHLDVGADLAALPLLLAGVWAVITIGAYGRLAAVFAGLSRTPPRLRLTLLVLDLVAFGLLWWRLTDRAPSGDRLDRTALLVAITAGLLAIAAIAAVWLTVRGDRAIGERTRRLEAQHRRTMEGDTPNEGWLERRPGRTERSD